MHATGSRNQGGAEPLSRFLREARPSWEEALASLVALPTVSADPACRTAIRRAAAQAAALIRSAGGRARVVSTPGHPVVLGWMGRNPAHPTVLLYNHLDVQPADPAEWRTPPFSMVRRRGRYYGRGTTDDKGPALTLLWAAAYARARGLPLNFVLVWEFEEEIGSPHLEAVLAARRRDLACDAVVVSDTVWVSADRPALTYGLRGLVAATLELSTGSRETHSGLVGGAARNPLTELCALAGSCYDEARGRVRIPGFYRGVRRLTPRERRWFASSGFRTRDFAAAHGLTTLRTRGRGEVMEAIWARPTFEVHGVDGGYRGPGVKTVVPPRAALKVSMRLVPDQDPARVFALFRDHARRRLPGVRVRCDALLAPYLTSPDHPLLAAAARALEWGFGRRPALIREGGSIGAVVSLHRVLSAPVILMGLSLPTHRYHGPDEYFEWRQVQGGVRSLVSLFSEIASGGTGP